jgi:hypothetical protein
VHSVRGYLDPFYHKSEALSHASYGIVYQRLLTKDALKIQSLPLKIYPTIFAALFDATVGATLTIMRTLSYNTGAFFYNTFYASFKNRTIRKWNDQESKKWNTKALITLTVIGVTAASLLTGLYFMKNFKKAEIITNLTPKTYTSNHSYKEDVDFLNVFEKRLPSDVMTKASSWSKDDSQRAGFIREYLEKNPNLFAKAESLILSDKQLESLPEEIKYFKNIEKLDLRKNLLHDLPKDFGNLFKKLREIDLSDNQLTSLPNSFQYLSNLESAVLSNNKFTMIPELIYNLSSLKLLDFSHNRITAIPELIKSMSKLQIIVQNTLIPTKTEDKSSSNTPTENKRIYSKNEPSEDPPTWRVVLLLSTVFTVTAFALRNQVPLWGKLKKLFENVSTFSPSNYFPTQNTSTSTQNNSTTTQNNSTTTQNNSTTTQNNSTTTQNNPQTTPTTPKKIYSLEDFKKDPKGWGKFSLSTNRFPEYDLVEVK